MYLNFVLLKLVFLRVLFWSQGKLTEVDAAAFTDNTALFASDNNPVAASEKLGASLKDGHNSG